MTLIQKLFGSKPVKEEPEMTNIQKALELIGTFASGDTEKAKGLLAEGYIQHNLAYGTGRDAFVGSVAYLASAPVKTTVENIRAFEDGDKVFCRRCTTLPARAGRWPLTFSALTKAAKLPSTGTIWRQRRGPTPLAEPR